MRASLFLLLIAPPLLLMIPTACPAEPDDLGARVEVALSRGARHLVSRQAEDGSWNKEDKVHPLGRTALCSYALLHAGVGADEVPVKKALAFLGLSRGYASKVEAISTYEAGCLLLLLNALGPGYEADIKRLCEWLVEHFDMGVGLWGYPHGTPDLSCTQYAAMGLKVGMRHGYVTPKRIWKKLLDTMVRLQADTGAMRYRKGTVYRATMTHAALLIMDYARTGLGAKRLPRPQREPAKDAVRWLEEHYDVEHNPFGEGHKEGHYYYYMYGLERWAMHFGIKEIDGHDWYREGAEVLLSRQKADGSWGNLEDTCFAMLFLRRATLGRPPVTTGGGNILARPENEKKYRDPPARPKPAGKIPFLRSWLVLGPFRSMEGNDDMLYKQHFDVRRVNLREGTEAGKQRWRTQASIDDKVELTDESGGSTPPWSCWYAGLWVHAPSARTAVLWVGADDGIKCYLNGKEIFEGHHHDYSGDDHYRIELPLKKGANALLLRIENTTYYCYFRARLSDPAGQAEAELKTSLTKKLRR